MSDYYRDSSHINGPKSIQVEKKGSDIEMKFDKDKELFHITLFALILTGLAIVFMPIKYIVEQILIKKEANDDIDTIEEVE